MRARRHLAKVTSFYLGSHVIIVELWLLFECCFVSLVLLIGFMRSKGTFKSCQAIGKDVHLLPLHDDGELSSRTTPFQEGGTDTGWPTDTTISSTSCASPTIHGLKAEVTEAWRRRRKKEASCSGTTARRQAVLPPQPFGPKPRKPEEVRRRVRARAVLPPPGERYYRPSGTTARSRAVLPLQRYYRQPERYYRSCGVSSSLSCLLMYPFAPTTINMTHFPTF